MKEKTDGNPLYNTVAINKFIAKKINNMSQPRKKSVNESLNDHESTNDYESTNGQESTNDQQSDNELEMNEDPLAM